MTTPLALFVANFKACETRMVKLVQSLEKTKQILPLDETRLQTLTDAQEDALDAHILRYSQCVAMMQDHLFRGIALIEQEDISDKSNRDKARLMEKLGAIKSADRFGTVAMLRNKFAHHYPEDTADKLERINLLAQETEWVLQTFEALVKFVAAKGYIPP